MDAARELAARMLALGEGCEKQIVLEALCWAVAGTIRHGYEEEHQQMAVESFAAHVPTLIQAIKAGEGRKPS